MVVKKSLKHSKKVNTTHKSVVHKIHSHSTVKVHKKSINSNVHSTTKHAKSQITKSVKHPTNKSTKHSIKHHKKHSELKLVKWILFILFCVTFIIIFLYYLQPPIQGSNVYGVQHRVSDYDIEFLYDLTYYDQDSNEYVVQQEIFDEIISLIDTANEFIVVDFFLLNNFGNSSQSSIPKSISKDFISALINKKRKNPSINIIVITDPVNSQYSHNTSTYLKKLSDEGITVVVSDLTELRDSNIFYSFLWRGGLRLIDYYQKTNTSLNPYTNNDYSLGQHLLFLNFKSNHRKLIVADSYSGYNSIITSMNIEDRAYYDNNVGIKIKNSVAEELFNSERKISEVFGTQLTPIHFDNKNGYGDIFIRVVSENKIKDSLILNLQESKLNSEIKLAQFYCSDPKIAEEIVNAANRGANISIILDSNANFRVFPDGSCANCYFAESLYQHPAITIKMYNSSGPKFHSKLAIFNRYGRTITIMGSADLSRKSLNNYNLDTSVVVDAPNISRFATEVNSYFSIIFDNNIIDFSTHYVGQDIGVFDRFSFWFSELVGSNFIES